MTTNDIIGLRSGMLVVVGRHEDHRPHDRVRCLCDCGRECVKLLFTVRSGQSRHCGCMKRQDHIKHGMFGTKIYRIWAGLRSRCSLTGGHPRYSGRGIKCCDRWASFEAFYEDMGDCPDGCSLDRIDNGGDYSPENCRWATSVQQSRNTRANRIVEIRGKRMTAIEAANEHGIKYTTFMRRLKSGMSAEEAVSVPVRKWTRSKGSE